MPFGILDKGDDNNLQNMPFDRFIYWNGDVELTLQVTGTPFQQGLAVFYFYPLANGSTVDLENTPACHHLFLTPEMSTTSTMVIPFRYPRSYLNTYTKGASQESLGTATLRVFSPLQSIDQTSATITLYSSFPNASFTIPRPLQAEGVGASRVSNVYNIDSLVGDMPVQNGTSISTSADVMIPMDNPPICSGAIPQMPVFSGMSKCVGVEPTVSLQLNPKSMYRKPSYLFDAEELTIEYLCYRETMIRSKNWGLPMWQALICLNYL